MDCGQAARPGAFEKTLTACLNLPSPIGVTRQMSVLVPSTNALLVGAGSGARRCWVRIYTPDVHVGLPEELDARVPLA